MENTLDKQTLQNLRVLSNVEVAHNTFILSLDISNDSVLDIRAGQFATFRFLNHMADHLFSFRRPFSIYDITLNSMQFVYEAKGLMTSKLGKLKQNDLLNVHYPIGNSFLDYTTPEYSNVLLVAGGLGIAPMLLCAKQLQKHHKNITLIYGARDKSKMIPLNNFKELGIEIILSTDDGSLGIHGNVIDVLKKLSPDKSSQIFCCGPERMMEKVTEFAKITNLPCYISLEKVMACSTGSCMGCTVETTNNGHIPTCLFGPVFDAFDIKWL